ncbi:hypothetical protein BLA6993_04116 [Burkholderia lata]|uniref:hypothetical protein n=1 Tax=Burkholderia lata (strain ATCC 17760 / DSM 23089 / LMG 22485 / NCIMB 9086 / R18194 / 383) TaxID=482957 RepID=UPI001452E15B|nr:hypothetical protein [Burkholderia lata]VWB86594.1 hypothetical protein BLA6993_04116 [Burkholderia lata]
MKRIQVSDQHLTWIPGTVLPFESAWSIFAKLMVSNSLSWSELRGLIKISKFRLDSGFNEFIAGQWVDIGKLSRLLGEPASILSTGFVDTLGFPDQLAYSRGIRHCPKCAQDGYHSSLFYIQALTHCPWHKSPLTAPCRKCSTILLEIFNHIENKKLTCPACRTSAIDLEVPVVSARISQKSMRAVLGRCNQLVNWWRNVQEKEPHAKQLLGLALCDADLQTECDEEIALRRGCLQRISNPPAFWPAEAPSAPGSIIAWKASVESTTDRKMGVEFTKSCYRSVRRKIFRTFVRPHRCCLAELTSMSRFEWMYLERDTICTPCIAYLAWRHANEGVSEPSTGHYDYKSRLKLWHLPHPGSSLRLADMSNLLYADYLRILMNLESKHYKRNVKIVSAPREVMMFSSFLENKHVPLPSITIEMPGPLKDNNSAISKVVIPDVSALAEISSERCIQRRRRSEGMSDMPYVEHWRANRSAWGDIADHSVLFKLRCFEGHSPRSYSVIYV